MEQLTFSPITEENYAQVAEIYDLGLKTGMATFETKVPPFQEWDKKHIPTCRIAVMDKDRMCGWAALSKTSSRHVYRGVVEVSIYIHPACRGKGVGKTLMNKLIDESEKNGFWTLHCSIMSDNKASISLHKKCGFREIGYREKIGMREGKWYDNVLMERRSRIVGI